MAVQTGITTSTAILALVSSGGDNDTEVKECTEVETVKGDGHDL